MNPLSDIGVKVDRTLKSVACAAAAGAAGVAALFFFSIGLFIWIREGYGTVVACLWLGLIYLVLALIAAGTVIVI